MVIEMVISCFSSHDISCPFIWHKAFFCLSGEYFPRVQNDSVWVWEDDSIAFDALENDYFAGHNITIFEFSKVGI